jgi:hypothetical protein
VLSLDGVDEPMRPFMGSLVRRPGLMFGGNSVNVALHAARAGTPTASVGSWATTSAAS